MLMEIVLSEEKALENNYSIKKCYKKLDEYFESKEIKKINEGVYQCEDFGKMSVAQIHLSYCDWFLKIVKEWFCRWESDDIEDREDCLVSFKKYGHLLNV